MKITVRITAYDRIPLLLECLKHLRKSMDYAKYRLFAECEYCIFVDYGMMSRKAIDIYNAISEANDERFKGFLETRSDRQIGADLNILRSLQHIDEDEEGYETLVVKLDSDILVSETFIYDMAVLAMTFDGMSTSTLYGTDPIETKIQKVNHITKWAMSGANFCINAKNLKKIIPMATALIETYKQNGHNPATTKEEWEMMKTLMRLYKPLHNEMNSPHRDFLLNSDVPNTASDAMIAVAAFCAGVPIVSYSVNRAIHPSHEGVNTTLEFWKQHYADVKLDELPPADPSKFVFV